jgi:ketosteroid isomerase-like protein
MKPAGYQSRFPWHRRPQPLASECGGRVYLAAQPPLRDTQRVMSEESTTSDLVELARRSLESGNGRDFDAMINFYAPDPVWDMSPMGLGSYEGLVAIRGFLEDWLGAYEEFEIEPEEILDLGNGVTLAVIRQGGRPVGSSGRVQLRYASVAIWVEGVMVRVTNYTDINEARADAERLAEERG